MKNKVVISTLYLPALLFFTDECNATYSYCNFVDGNSIFTEKNNFLENLKFSKDKGIYNSPIIKTKLGSEVTQLEFEAQKLSYNPSNYNFIVFYEYKEGENIELFRQLLDYSGKGIVNDAKVLSKLKNNMTIFARVESFTLEDGKIANYKQSKNSINYFTPKSYNLEIIESNNVVYNSDIISDEPIKKDGSTELPLNYLRKYVVDKFYSYDGSKVFVDGKEIANNKNLLLPYSAKKITVDLAKVNSEWSTIKLVYPTIFKQNNIQYSEKLGTEFQDFITKNINSFVKEENVDYKFLGYFVSNKNVIGYKEKIASDLTIEARYDTKIILKYDNKIANYYLPTGTSLADLNLKLLEKENYLITGYKITNNFSGEEKTVASLEKEYVLDSVTIEPQYKVKTNKISIRQDEYNSRFGQVFNDVNKRDVEWDEITPIGKLLTELKKDIKPNIGYELQFRINRKEVEPTEFIKKDSLLEIYFRRIEDKWINVKFVGDGIDKFLSDGQEILVGNKLDNINLPTSSGVSNKLLGWEVNKDYSLEKDGKKYNRSKDMLVKNTDLPYVVAEKGGNLIFTAVYEKFFDISFYNDINGKIYVDGNDKGFSIAKDITIRDGLNGKKVIIIPSAHHKFLYFTSTLPVTIIKNNNKIVIPVGEKISLDDFYNIVVDKNLTFIPYFPFLNGITDNLLESTDYYIIHNKLERNYGKNLNEALGPLKFLL